MTEPTAAPPPAGEALTIVVIADPLEELRPEVDTSLALMAAAGERGHSVWHCTPTDVSWYGGTVVADARLLTTATGPGSPGTGPVTAIDLSGADAILIRADPPVDSRYLHLTHIMDLVGSRPLVVNRPAGLRDANEKLWACRFADLMPPTVVSADRDRLWACAREWGAAVVKSLDSHAGRAVHVLDPADRNARALLDTATGRGRRAVMAQQFVDDVYRGDKRILLLAGQPLGAINRVPPDGDFRANLAVGGRVEPADIDDADARIIDRLRPALCAAGLWLVGIDVIGGRLSEVNVTSPTGLRQMMEMGRGRPDTRVIRWIEDRVRDRPDRHG